MGLHMLAAAVPTGNYVNGLKVIPVVVVLIVWLRLMTWVDKDTLANNMPRERINTGLMGGVVIGFAAFLFLPTFLIAFATLVAVAGVEAIVFLQYRKQKMGLGDLRGEFNNWIASIRGAPAEVEEIAGAVQLVGTDGQLLPAPKKDAPEAEAYEGIQKMLTDPLTNSADEVLIAPAEGGAAVKYTVDGVTYQGASVTKAVSADALVYLKAAAGLDAAEVRKPQKGSLKLNINGKRREMRLETRGSTAGESARFVADVKNRHSFTPETLGMSVDQVDTIKMVNELGGGITILSAPKGQGLTSLSYGMLKAHDSFLQFIQTVERDPEQDLEGITQNKLERGATAEEETKMVLWIISQQPNVLLVSKPESPATAAALVDAATGERRIYVALNASSAFEALNVWQKLVGDDKLAVKRLQLVINGRPLRKLCTACKQAYTPDPETLRKLNMDPARVAELYQARKEPARDPKGNPIKCEFCNDLRYKGRTGIYELLLVDDPVVQVASTPMTPEQKQSLMKTAFRKQRGKYLQESGLALVERGETSVQEVLRVLKPADEGGSAPPRSGGGSRRRPPPTPKGPVAVA
jgi:type II secretory ATPase GspE/PulE/Tfp pilus assembly ATPase PilB-like protein